MSTGKGSMAVGDSTRGRRRTKRRGCNGDTVAGSGDTRCSAVRAHATSVHATTIHGGVASINNPVWATIDKDHAAVNKPDAPIDVADATVDEDGPTVPVRLPGIV